MKVMETRALKVLFGLACLMMGLGVRADVFTHWDRRYHVGSNKEEFVDVAIDPIGNVYAIGVSHNGTDKDALIVRIGPGGDLYWAIKFTGAGDQIGRFVRLSPDGSQLYIAYDQPTTQTKLVRLNPASGAVMWSRTRSVPSPDKYSSGGLFLTQPSGSTRLYWPIRYQPPTGNGIDTFLYDEFGSAVNGQAYSTGGAERVVLDIAGRPQGGAYYLIGDPLATSPDSEVWVMGAGGTRSSIIPAPNATAIGSTAAAGGQLFAVGGYNTNRVSLTRIRTDTNVVNLTIDNILSGATGIAIQDVDADAHGNLYVAGVESTTYASFRFLARYSTQTLVRIWRTARDTPSGRYYGLSHVAADPYGNVAASGNWSDPAGFGGSETKVYDGKTGLLLGGTEVVDPNGNISVATMAANADGMIATGGKKWDYPGPVQKGMLWLTKQRGLKRLSQPSQLYVGGSVIPVTVTMYGSAATNRSVALSSSSALAPVPASILIALNTVARSFNIVTGRTGTDVAVTITGTFEGVARTTSFTVLAPRPSSLTFTPNSVVGGNSSSGRVNLTGLAPAAGAVVTLASNGPQVVVPPSVTIPNGAGFGTFNATTIAVVSTVVRTVSATAHGVTKTATLTVNP